MLKLIRILLCLFTLSLTENFAQQTFPLGNFPYVQNFDGLANTGINIAWTNGGIPLGAGWQSNRSTYSANDGHSNAGGLYSYGGDGSNERALGSLASGSTGTVIFGVCFTNNTGRTINSITVNYTGEQWRQTTAIGNGDSLVFEYRIGVNSVTASGTWTNVPALNFNPPQSGIDGALDGNNPANRISLSQTISPFVVLPKQNFCLRWSDANSVGFDKGMAVDDLQLYFLTKPTTDSQRIKENRRLQKKRDKRRPR